MQQTLEIKLGKTLINPKDGLGCRKAGLSCLPSQPLFECGLAMMTGAMKYGRHNWRKTPVVASVYYDAAMRHIMAWWEGQDFDQESGLNHLAHAMACLVILRDADIHNTLNNNRAFSSKDPHWQTGLNAEAKRLTEPRESGPGTPVPRPTTGDSGRFR